LKINDPQKLFGEANQLQIQDVESDEFDLNNGIKVTQMILLTKKKGNKIRLHYCQMKCTSLYLKKEYIPLSWHLTK
jgi:hypothetical protein